MKRFSWNPEKNETVKAKRGISFEGIVVAIEAGGLLDILVHSNQAKCTRRRVLVVECDNYAFLVPFLEEDDYFVLRAIIPSRKATRNYLNQGEIDVEN
jgi:uncharacterized DUF497 family protein